MIIIYHNNRCSKSRQCLDIIKKSNLCYKVVEYLKEEFNISIIKKIVYGLEGEIKDIVRSDEKVIKGIKIDFTNKDDVIKLIGKYKICMQRPVVNVNEKFVICRPPEKVLNLIRV